MNSGAQYCSCWKESLMFIHFPLMSWHTNATKSGWILEFLLKVIKRIIIEKNRIQVFFEEIIYMFSRRLNFCLLFLQWLWFLTDIVFTTIDMLDFFFLKCHDNPKLNTLIQKWNCSMANIRQCFILNCCKRSRNSSNCSCPSRLSNLSPLLYSSRFPTKIEEKSSVKTGEDFIMRKKIQLFTGKIVQWQILK